MTEDYLGLDNTLEFRLSKYFRLTAKLTTCKNLICRRET